MCVYYCCRAGSLCGYFLVKDGRERGCPCHANAVTTRCNPHPGHAFCRRRHRGNLAWRNLLSPDLSREIHRTLTASPVNLTCSMRIEKCELLSCAVAPLVLSEYSRTSADNECSAVNLRHCTRPVHLPLDYSHTRLLHCNPLGQATFALRAATLAMARSL